MTKKGLKQFFVIVLGICALSFLTLTVTVFVFWWVEVLINWLGL